MEGIVNRDFVLVTSIITVNPDLQGNSHSTHWSYQSPEQLRSLYKNDELRLDEVEEFILSSKPGHFIPLDKKLLFRVSQCTS